MNNLAFGVAAVEEIIIMIAASFVRGAAVYAAKLIRR
jgi:hypothetical protein